MLGGMGVDLGDAPLDTRLTDLHVEGGRGVLQAIIDSVPGGRPNIEDMVRYRAERMRLVGTPEQIADELERWQDAGIDGINVISHVIPGSYTEVIEDLLPRLDPRHRKQIRTMDR
jgi:long-chain alkane monooxygenase